MKSFLKAFAVLALTLPVFAVGVPEIEIEQPEGLPVGGTPVAWGQNRRGETVVPVGLTRVTSIAAGLNHTVAVTSDGTVVAWGSNTYGQTSVPVGLNEVTAISAGSNHTVALRSNGSVVAWGYNGQGQTSVPNGLNGVMAIAAGYDHTVALKSDGSVVAWGYNGPGPTDVLVGVTDIEAISTGGDEILALKSDGTVVAWSVSGQTTVPAGLTGVIAISAGASHKVALKSDGSVVAWGSNAYGQTSVPPGLTGVTGIVAGYLHTLALKYDGTVVAWGSNGDGETTVPAGLIGVTTMAQGGSASHVVALVEAKLAFGSQTVTTTSAAKTFTVKNTGSAALIISSVSVVGGHASDFAVDTSEMSASVPFPNGATSFMVTFTPSDSGPRQTTLRVSNSDLDEAVIDITLTGHGFSPGPEIAIEQPAGIPAGGIPIAWGNNLSGQRNVPPGLTGVTEIAAGVDHTVALRSDGSVVA